MVLTRQAIWFVCLFVLLGTTATDGHAQSKRTRPAPEYLQLGKPDQEKGRRILQSFREKGLYAGDNYFEFELRVMPRRGTERTVVGRLWTGDNEQGPVSRYILAPGVKNEERRLLVQNGRGGAVWSWRPGSNEEPARVDGGGLHEALAGTDVAPFDLQMGYLYWTDFAYEGVSKVRGRPADTFLLYPPEHGVGAVADLSAVRVYLDAQYEAPVQAEYIGGEGRPVKRVSVIDLKRLGEQWVVKSIDFRNEVTRDKTRFSLTGAAVGLDFSRALFAPGMLVESIQPPPADQVQQVIP